MGNTLWWTLEFVKNHMVPSHLKSDFGILNLWRNSIHQSQVPWSHDSKCRFQQDGSWWIKCCLIIGATKSSPAAWWVKAAVGLSARPHHYIGECFVQAVLLILSYPIILSWGIGKIYQNLGMLKADEGGSLDMSSRPNTLWFRIPSSHECHPNRRSTDHELGYPM